VSSSSAAVPYGDETVVAEPAWVWVLVFAGFPAAGAGVGWLLAAFAGRLADVPFVPFDFALRWVEDAPQPAAAITAAGAGAALGLVFAVLGWEERLTVAVSLEGVTLRRGRSSRTVPRGDVAGAFVDGKEVVLLTRGGGEAARERSDLDAEALRAAFTGHGYAWHPGGDPHAADYARWVPGLPGLPPAADALLKARAKAVEKSDKDDAASLRAELAKLGVVVRDENKRQLYRLSGDPGATPH
jgi:hypothetical protein